MKPLAVIVCLSLVALTRGQRPFFAGSKPIGYPEVTTEALADRFGEVDGTTQRLPVEANGDRDLVDRLSKLPVDKQPFWLINWQALEANRNKPQTYPQKPNVFAESAPSSGFNSNTNFENGNSNFNSANVSPSFGNVSPSNGNVNPNFGNVNPSSGNVNPNFGNGTPNSGHQNPNSANQIPYPSNQSPTFGNQSPNSGNLSPNSDNQSPNSGSALTNQGFESSNRFGVEEYPKQVENKQENPVSNANTNINPGYGKPVPLGSFDKKKLPVQNTYYESYRF